MATLQTYLTQTRRLLHDATGKYWTDVDLIDAINQAQRRVVVDSACLRRLQTCYISGGLEVYGYGSVSGATVNHGGLGYVASTVGVTTTASPTGDSAVASANVTAGSVVSITVSYGGSGYLTAPTFDIAPAPPGGVTATCTPTIVSSNTLDVLNITLLWGSMRITLERKPFTWFQAFARAWQGYSQRPAVCAQYGQDKWYIGPIPDQYYVSEWDTVIAPTDLSQLTDISQIRTPYDDVLPFYAAHIAKFKEQSHNEADVFLNLYQRKMQWALKSANMRTIPSVYGR